MKRVITYFLLMCMLLTALSAFCITTSGAEPQWEVSEEYKGSHFYDNLLSVNLTGDMRSDVIAVALSQIGYHEGNSDADMHGYNTWGSRDFVEYNRQYGKLDNQQGNGYSYGYYWCASFVNWVLRQAQVPKDIAGGEVSCPRWINNFFSPKGLYVPSSTRNFTPETGDLIFFKGEGSTAISTHIGIVLCYADNTVYTIEGNTSNSSAFSSNGNYVCIKSYPKTSSYIVGYGTPKYTEKSNVFKVDYTGVKKTCGMYIANSKIKVYSQADINSDEVTEISQFHIFTVNSINGYWYRVTAKTDSGVIEGWTQLSGKAHQMTSDGQEIYSVIYKSNDPDVKTLPISQSANAGTSINITTTNPRKSRYVFLGWSTDENATEVQYHGGDEVALTEDLTLYPVFTERTYTVTFKMPDGTVISEITGRYGESLTAPQVTPEPGFIFVGWNKEVESTITSSTSYEALTDIDPDYVPETESISESMADTETNVMSETDQGSPNAFTSFGCKGYTSSIAALLIIFSSVCAVSVKKKK